MSPHARCVSQLLTGCVSRSREREAANVANAAEALRADLEGLRAMRYSVSDDCGLDLFFGLKR